MNRDTIPDILVEENNKELLENNTENKLMDDEII